MIDSGRERFPRKLHERYGIKEIVVSTYQSASGAGYKGISELIEQTRGSREKKIFPKQILYNVIPLIGNIEENGFTQEEMKMVNGKIKAVIYCVILTLAFIVTIYHTSALPQQPHQFYGTAIVAGQPAPDGTRVEAKINNVTYATTTTTDGKYGYSPLFMVPADDPDTSEKEGGATGDTVDFYLAGTYAASYPFQYGATTELNLTVTAPTPYADFTATPTNGTEPLTVNFTDQSMYFDTIQSYTWNFGDGNITTTTNANITHTYIQNGTYTVTLTVNGTWQGLNITKTETKTDYITVYDTKPIANFYATPTVGPPPLTVSFYDNSTSYDGIIAWTWNFGDGNSSSEQNPIHTYTDIGTYTVTLTVTEPDGDNNTCTKTNYISVQLKPIVTIDSPTTENPTYTQSGLSVNITVTYTELNPLNETITIYNSTTIIAEWTNQTALTSGTNTTTIQITIPSWASDGKYNVNATIFNIYNLSATATQENAIIIDNTPPTVEITYPTENTFLSVSTIWINGTITEENLGTNQPKINDARFEQAYWNNITGEFSFKNKTAIPDGTLTITVNFTDLAQNTASDTVTFTLDTTPPAISNPYQNPPGQIIQPNTIVNVDAGQNVTVTTNITEPYLDTVTLSYKINQTQWINITMTHTTGNEYTATIPSSNLPVGANVTYYITATDKAGNTAKTPTNGIYFQYSIVPEFTTLTMLIILLISTILAVAINRKRKP